MHKRTQSTPVSVVGLFICLVLGRSVKPVKHFDLQTLDSEQWECRDPHLLLKYAAVACNVLHNLAKKQRGCRLGYCADVGFFSASGICQTLWDIILKLIFFFFFFVEEYKRNLLYVVSLGSVREPPLTVGRAWVRFCLSWKLIWIKLPAK